MFSQENEGTWLLNVFERSDFDIWRDHANQ